MAAVGRPGDEPAVTTAGTRLDPDYEPRLGAEAEAGFDPATLIRCHAGRALAVRTRRPLQAGRPPRRRSGDEAIQA